MRKEKKLIDKIAERVGTSVAHSLMQGLVNCCKIYIYNDFYIIIYILNNYVLKEIQQATLEIDECMKLSQ